MSPRLVSSSGKKKVKRSSFHLCLRRTERERNENGKVCLCIQIHFPLGYVCCVLCGVWCVLCVVCCVLCVVCCVLCVVCCVLCVVCCVLCVVCCVLCAVCCVLCAVCCV